jgi:uncharacterized protein
VSAVLPRKAALDGKPTNLCTDTIDLGNQALLIDRETGRWIIAPHDRASALRGIDQHGSTTSLLSSGLISPGELNSLWRSGLLSVSGARSRPGHGGQQAKDASLYVLSITKGCNLACDYCYASAQTAIDAVPLAVARKVFEAATREQKEVSILFHGGEPFLHFDYLQKLVQLGRQIASENGSHIRFRAQTNGVLINRQVVSFIKENRIALGVSIDGYTDAQNSGRLQLGGRSSTARTLAGIELLLDQKIPFGLNIVITQNNRNDLAGIIRHFHEMGVSDFYFNPIMPVGRGRETISQNALTPLELFEAMKSALDEVIRLRTEGKEVYLKNISYLLLNMVSDQYLYMCQSAPCGAGTQVLSVDVDGSVFTCDDFNGLPELSCGNIMKDSLAHLRNKAGCSKCALREPDKIDGCWSCPWKAICCSGCASNAYFWNGSFEAKTPWCEYYDRMIRHLFEEISKGLDPYLLIPGDFWDQPRS